MWKSNIKNIFHIISHVGLSECSQTTWYSSFLIVQSLTMSAHSRQSEQQNIKDGTHIWQQCSVTISGDISTTKYDFYFRQIMLLCWLNGINYETNSATFRSTEWSPFIYGNVRFLRAMVNRMMHKVDPHFDAYRRLDSLIKSCIGHKYVCFYEIRCRIDALMN